MDAVIAVKNVLWVKEEKVLGAFVGVVGILCVGINSFKPFQSNGWVSADEQSVAVAIKIIRDMTSEKSIVVRDTVHFLEDTLTGEHFILKALGEAHVVTPLVRLYLNSGFATKFLNVAVQDVVAHYRYFVFGDNDIADEVVVPEPIVTFTLLIDSFTTELEKASPELFPSCAVTRSQVAKVDSTVDVEWKSSD